MTTFTPEVSLLDILSVVNLIETLAAQKTIDDLKDRVAKLENKQVMKGVLQDSGLPDSSIDCILKAIDDMSDKIKTEMNEKLEDFVRMPEFKDLSDLT